MYFKISLGNVKKSYKDYGIYFLTITLAVCIFYSFNSLESQKVIIEMKNSGAGYIDILTSIISIVSIFVSIILFSLILYANNFLIKKRKKEFGVYKILGMSKNKISRILVIETLIVGISSLVIGLVLGGIASQGLSLFTAKLFDTSMSKYSFVLSTSAILKTMFYFGIIFLLVMIFNVYLLSKYKVIDLLSAERKNEDLKFKNPLIYIFAFITCIITLTTAYKLAIYIGLKTNNPIFWIAIILGVIGTILFFFSLSGFFLFIFKSNKKIYFKHLNLFVLKQIYSKVNTNFLSMSIICLMLFLTIVILSTGLSFKRSLENGLKESTPFAVSATMMINENSPITSVKEALKNSGVNFDKNIKYVCYNEYISTDITINRLLSNMSKKTLSNHSIVNNNVSIIKISDFNHIRKLENKENIDLDSNEVLILSNSTDMQKVIYNFLNHNDKVNIGKKYYKVKNKMVLDDALKTDIAKSNVFTLIVSDNLVKNYTPMTSNININFNKESSLKLQSQFSTLFKNFRNGDYNHAKTTFVLGYTKNDIYNESNGLTNTVLFVGIYLGIIFLIASMAVLALQQLSEASDSIDRYKSLKKLSASDKMINKCIFIQTLIYFTLPVGLAFVHSIIGIKVANDFISTFNKPNIGVTSIVTALFFIAIYTGYFYATYIGYKNIVENS
ncbi:ABC transporter permease [Paraclostridium bifermentans]|uniref:ABC transporter permease n=1 Tax=Paraclostridium bifermentans TaxID=1490 RepID=UPI001F2B71CD|nr:ABC transporter permease [Paraclostridium bifermentans]MCE9676705.1 ABC transporter permease [Paraclostridium bifermentans]